MGNVEAGKRPPDEPHLSAAESSPARSRQKTHSAGVDAPAKVVLRSIKVTQVLSSATFTKKPKKKRKRNKTTAPVCANAEEARSDESGEWWKITYTIFLSGKSPHNRIKCHSDKATWKSDDPAKFMMEKVQAFLATKASALNLDFNDGLGNFYMNDSTPWEYLWAKAENDIGKINKQSLSNTAKLLKGHQTRVDACLAQN